MRIFGVGNWCGVGFDNFIFATSKVNIIDFDDRPGLPTDYPPIFVSEEYRISTQYLSTHGVVFSSGSSWVPVLRIPPYQVPSAPNLIAGSRPNGYYTCSSEFPVVAKFFYPNNPSRKATTDFVAITGNHLGAICHGATLYITLKAYDSDGNEIGTTTKQDLGGTVLQIEAPGIHEVRFFGTADWLGVGIDNFTFSPIKNLPVADAGENVIITGEELNATVIQGTVTNPDIPALTFRWKKGVTELSGWTTLGEGGAAPLYLATVDPNLLGIGPHTLTLEVSDGENTVTDDMVLTVGNSSPHAVANGGTYELGADVILGGTVSDYDGGLLNYKWIKDGSRLYEGNVQSSPGGAPVLLPVHSHSGLGLGNHDFFLEVSDGFNASVTVKVAVTVVDTNAPALAPVPSIGILWPPDHRMVEIVITANSSDISGTLLLSVGEITSNEPQNGLGDGDIAPDWTIQDIDQLNGVIKLALRAERSGKGEGRIYTIPITVTDSSGNSTTAAVKVKVPHDQRKTR